MTKPTRFFVLADISKATVVAYTVNLNDGRKTVEHARYEISPDRSATIALHLANQHRDDLNAEIA